MGIELQDRIYLCIRNRKLGTRIASLIAKVNNQRLHRYEIVDALSCLQSEIRHSYKEPWWSYWRIFIVGFLYCVLGLLFGSMLDPMYLEWSLALIVFIMISGCGFFLVGLLFIEYLYQIHHDTWNVKAQQIIIDLEEMKTKG